MYYYGDYYNDYLYSYFSILYHIPHYIINLHSPVSVNAKASSYTDDTPEESLIMFTPDISL